MLLGVLVFVSYAILTVNTSAVARQKYIPTAISAALFMLVNFLLIRHIADAKSAEEFISYLVGGVAGDLCGIWLSKRFTGAV